MSLIPAAAGGYLLSRTGIAYPSSHDPLRQRGDDPAIDPVSNGKTLRYALATPVVEQLSGVILQNAEVRDGVRHPEPIPAANAQRRNHVHILALHFGDLQLS